MVGFGVYLFLLIIIPIIGEKTIKEHEKKENEDQEMERLNEGGSNSLLDILRKGMTHRCTQHGCKIYGDPWDKKSFGP